MTAYKTLSRRRAIREKAARFADDVGFVQLKSRNWGFPKVTVVLFLQPEVEYLKVGTGAAGKGP